MNFDFKSLLLFSFLLLTGVVFSQEDDEYDYVLPDSLEEPQKRSKVSLPIRGNQDPSPQYFVPSYKQDKMNDQAYGMYDPNEPEVEQKENKTTVNLELGSSVMTDFNGNSAINTYVAPHIRYQVSKDLAVSGGVMMSKTFFNGWTHYNLDGSSMPSSLFTTMIYGQLEYQLNDRMTVYGAIYKNITSYPSSIGSNNQLDGLGYSVGMKYRVSERSFIQVQVSRSSGYNPFMPYSSSYGFGNRPFNSFP